MTVKSEQKFTYLCAYLLFEAHNSAKDNSK